jgi:hypothetical protein
LRTSILILLFLIASSNVFAPRITDGARPSEVGGPAWLTNHYFPRFATPDKLYAIDIPNGIPESVAITLVSLQGIVNREKPIVYLVFDRYSEFWLSEIQKSARIALSRINSTEGLDVVLSEFRSKVRGLVVYDPSVPDTLNVATTIAGLEDRLIVDPSQVDELRDKYALSDVLDLRTYVTTYGWNNQNEGRVKLYEWVYDNLWNRVDRRIIGVANPGPPVSRWATTIGVREYVVALRLVTLYLSATDPTQTRLYERFLSTAPKPAVVFGWTGFQSDTEEDPTVSLVSSYGHWVSVLSHPFDPFKPSNLSVLSGVAPPLVKYNPRIDPQRVLRTTEPGVYVTAYVTDGDNMGGYDYTLGWDQWAAYGDSDVSIGWTVNPVLIDVAPIIWNFYVNNAGSQTTMVSGAGAAGYMDPHDMNPSDLERYLHHAQVYWNETGIRTAQIIPELPFEYRKFYSAALSPLGLFSGYRSSTRPGMLPFPLGGSNVETFFQLQPDTGLPVAPNFYSFSFSPEDWSQEQILASLSAAAGGSEMPNKELTFRAADQPGLGQVISDATSSSGTVRVAYSKQGLSDGDAIVFGPYITIPAGSYTASFVLRVSDTEPSGFVGKIDVAAELGRRIIVEQDLVISQFSSNKWQEFKLPFTLKDTTANVELRVHFYRGVADLYCDHSALLKEGGWPAYGRDTPVFVAISFLAAGGPAGTASDPQRALDLLRRIAVLDPRVHLLTTDEFFAAINPAYMLDLERNTLSKADPALLPRQTTKLSRSAEDNYRLGQYTKSLEFSREAITNATESLIVNITPPGSGTPRPEIGSYLLPKGSSITVTQTSRDGYKFDHWLLDGAPVSNNLTITLRMDMDHNLTAVYVVQLSATTTLSLTATTSAEQTGTSTVVPTNEAPWYQPLALTTMGVTALAAVALLLVVRKRRSRKD